MMQGVVFCVWIGCLFIALPASIDLFLIKVLKVFLSYVEFFLSLVLFQLLRVCYSWFLDFGHRFLAVCGLRIFAANFVALAIFSRDGLLWRLGAGPLDTNFALDLDIIGALHWKIARFLKIYSELLIFVELVGFDVELVQADDEKSLLAGWVDRIVVRLISSHPPNNRFILIYGQTTWNELKVLDFHIVRFTPIWALSRSQVLKCLHPHQRCTHTNRPGGVKPLAKF